MHSRNIVFVCLILTCIFAVSCQKLEQKPTVALKFEKMKYLDAVPSEYGNLVGVTMNSEYPSWAQLWFEKPDKTIMVVRVNWGVGHFEDNVLIIPRR